MGEKINVVGYRNVSFKDDSGRVVEGRSYYYTQKVDGVVGVLAGKLFVSKSVLDGLKHVPDAGQEVMVYYNRYGKPSSFELLK